ncbi:hypothetical protein EDB83DRAFT_2322229 [Lactarius deliciosus]|nr:hypothetical protein EDB83DRAFT_2322229 [Lactarius deliciosus]
MSDISRHSRSQSRAAAGTPPSQQPSPQPQLMGPPLQQHTTSMGGSDAINFLSRMPSPVVPIPSVARPADIPREDAKRRKKHSPSPLGSFMDRIPASQRIAHNPSEVSEAPTHHPEIISVDDQTTETPSAGAPTSSLALSIHDTMDVDDGGSGIGPVPIPSEGGTPKRQLGHSAPRARPSRSAPSRTVIHPIGVTLPASPMADDLGSIESRLERCKLILTDAWDDLRDLRGRLQLFDDGIYRALLDLESMGKYLEGKDLFAKGSQTP